MKVHLIEFTPARLMHVALPKTGSTSLMACYLMMAGLAGSPDAVRPFLRSKDNKAVLRKAGLVFRRVDAAKLAQLREERPDWALLATVRNPYDRALSNWFSKINRYTKRFAPGLYAYGKLRQFLSGPRGWPDIGFANRPMQARLPFPAFLDGLIRHGIDFDNHFRQQADLLSIDTVRYDRLFRLEEFDATFLPALQELGVPADLTRRLSAIPHSNETGSRARAAALLTDQARHQIEMLYDRDFRLLGYEKE